MSNAAQEKNKAQYSTAQQSGLVSVTQNSMFYIITSYTAVLRNTNNFSINSYSNAV